MGNHLMGTQGIPENGIEVVVFDTETTGTTSEDRILQIAWLSATIYPDGSMRFGDFFEEIINPQVAIKPEAAAVHGFWKDDIVGAPLFKDSKAYEFFSNKIKQSNTLFIAHNASFDVRFLRKEGSEVDIPLSKYIDTLKIAQVVFASEQNPENPNALSGFGLQVLRYYFDFDSQVDFQELLRTFGVKKIQPHTAFADVIVLFYLFLFFFNKGYVKDTNHLLKIAFSPAFKKEIDFGRVFEKGTPYSEVITGTYSQGGRQKRGIEYLNWAITSMENLSLMRKVNISYQVMLMLYHKKIPCDHNVSPMISLASAFIPGTWETIRGLGRDPVSLRNLCVAQISNIIQTKLNSEDSAIVAEGEALKEEFDFLNFYFDRFSEQIAKQQAQN